MASGVDVRGFTGFAGARFGVLLFCRLVKLGRVFRCYAEKAHAKQQQEHNKETAFIKNFIMAE